MYYHIISSDLDGTLLAPNSSLTDLTINVVQSLVKKGVYFIIATGRHYFEAIKVRNNLGILTFLITSNGARIYDPYDQLVYSSNVNKYVILDLIKLCSLDKDILIQLYSHDSWYISNNYSNNGVNLYNSFGFKYTLLDLKNLIFLDFNKVFFTSSNLNKLHFLQKYILDNFKSKVNVNFSCSNCLEVVSNEVSKGNALQLVSNLLGISLKKCLSFGDGMNDKDMLEISGKGCIMKNGQHFLKESLSDFEVIGSNFEDGVANYLIKIFNLLE
ncbi:hypothetical protein XW81_00140 [Buchnera aphidicola (Schlechtendalia chinensis)]|uniref:Cof-type HAD-IIB family hydrolase n=1 Tax=Buchnera aphidicola subsp. Schlechtendalia chinensis TaxID=118110 RepID=A0A172WD09_BUCSC|nr:Cof-type HAD-IIB family hydrolase [Buchnera aphidicola]ANF16852.1 hypothetical protein XW81_00140 [Buchnera aphidicola (Schlechtendalia chinensis)]